MCRAPRRNALQARQTSSSPTPQTLPRALPACVLALGAHLKNKACLAVGEQAFWSAAHGDLADVQACTALQASVDRLLALAREQGHAIQAVAHDLHPDFFSTRLALQTAERLGVPAIPVQHHHAHVAVLLAEAGLTQATTGLSLDGYGMGSDGTAWGGELLRVGTDAWQRLGRLSPLALPGGDRAAREPWRMAAAVLHALGRTDEIVPRWSAAVGETAAQGIATMLARGLRCPMTSSAGRWFDAAAAALGVCLRQDHEAEAAIALQQRAQAWLDRQPPDGLADIDAVARHRLEPDGELNLLGLLEPLLACGDPATARDGDAVGRAAAQFHVALAAALADWVCHAVAADGAPFVVALSGGCFHNGLLRAQLQRKLAQRGGSTLTTAEPGDATLALGQAWVAAWQLVNGRAPAPTGSNSPAEAIDPEGNQIMCLAVPARVVECLEGDRALIDLEGVRMDISVELLDDVHPGDYVIVHVGYAIGKLDEQEALATLKAMAAMAQTDAASTTPSGPREGALP